MCINNNIINNNNNNSNINDNISILLSKSNKIGDDDQMNNFIQVSGTPNRTCYQYYSRQQQVEYHHSIAMCFLNCV